MSIQCSLCNQLSDGPFCCTGCETVYGLLQERGAEKLPPVTQEPPQELHRLRFEIEDLFCIYCKEVIEWVLKRTEGIHQAIVDYATDLCLIDYDPRKITPEEIFAKIRSVKYTPKHFEEERKGKGLHLQLGVSAFCALNIMMFSYSVFAGLIDGGWGHLFATLSFLCALPILFYAGLPIFKRGILSALHGIFGMETLVTLGVFASFILSTYNLFHQSIEVYYDTLAVIVTFVLLGKVVEQKAKFSAKEQMRLLFKSLPKRARVGEQFVLLKDLQEEDVITSLTGEKIVADGVVVEGEGWLDISLLTGESQPHFIGLGMEVKSGSILLEGNLKYTKGEGKSTLESIVELVEQSLLHKQPSKGLLDTILPFFVPLVSLLSLFSPHPLAQLLISCPCAIGIAIPLAESKMIEKLLSIGVVVRNRNALHLLGKEKAYVFDKTGTLTNKKLHLTTSLGDRGPIIKTMALHSIHPVAKAVAKALEQLPKVALDNIKEIKGKGIVAADRYFLGSSPECSLVFMEPGKEPLQLDLEDVIRPEVPALLAALQGVDLYLYSGDHLRQVEAVATQLNIPHFAARLSPQEKKEKIGALEGIIVFVGDGINDAPALGAASLSFVPLNGSDLASQAADFLLTKEDLTLIPQARSIAQKGHQIIQQNLFWAFFYNLLGIPLAYFGLLNPILASIFMVCSSLIVLLNSKR